LGFLNTGSLLQVLDAAEIRALAPTSMGLNKKMEKNKPYKK